MTGVHAGQVWSDNDPRGGPTFRIVDIDGPDAIVTNLDGKRQRRIKIARLRPGKRGYTLHQSDDPEVR